MRKIATMLLALLSFITVKAQTTLVNEGFESIPHSFTSSVTATVRDWDTTSVLKYAGLMSLRGKVPATGVTSVVTAKFATLGYSKVFLRFKHICKLAPTDKGNVRFRVNGSSGTWTNIPKSDTVYLTTVPAGDNGYLITSMFNANSYSEWDQANLTTVPTNTWWRSEMFDLSSFISNKDTAEIQFRIQNGGTAGTNAAYGWLIDNIEIIGANNEIAPPVIVQQPVIYQDTIYGVGPWTIKAKVTDASTVNAVNLVYSTLRNGVPTGPFSLIMTADTGHLFYAEIPTQSYGTKVTYHVFAQDQYGNDDQTTDKWFFNKKQPAEIIVGTGTSTQRQPFGAYFGYERSAAIYTAAEIGTFGTIANMSWNVASAQATNIPTKIYLKSTTSSTLTADTWANLTTGATLVYDATRAYSPLGWNLIDITDFSYTTGNVMVLCETNYTGSGTSTYPTFYYTTTTGNQHEYFAVDDAAPTTSGTVSTARPNVKFGFIQVPIPLDAAMQAIVTPPTTLITTSISDVKVKIKSNGGDDLTTVRINWALDGVVQSPTYIWNGLLTEDQVSPEITIAPAFNFVPGSHNVKIWVSDPNSGVDLVPANDTMQVNLFSCGGILSAGTYTVGGTSPDFATLNDVKLKLMTCGISGPVTFNIRPGTYYTNVAFGKILGGSATNTVTIKSENNNPTSVVILDTTNSVATFVLDTISNFRVQSLTLKKTNRFNNKLVWLRGRNIDVQFTNNIFEGLDTNLTADNYALVYSSKGTLDKDSLIVFDGNTFKNGTIGLYLAATTTNPSINLTVQNNTFLNQAYRGLHMYYFNKYNVTNNTIRQNQNSTQSFSGLYVSYCKEGQSVSANKVMSTKLNCGLYLYYSKGLSTSPLLVSNNFISAYGVTSSGIVATSGCGMYVYSCDSINIFNNTVNLSGIDSVASRSLLMSLGSVINVRNNNLANNIKGYAYFVNTVPTNLLSNYNNLFSNGAFIGSYSATNATTINAWQTASTKDTNSISVNPSFLTWDNFHTFEIGLNGSGQPLSSVITDIENNPRNATTPDIGCDEFDVASNDLGIVSVLQPISTYSCGTTGVSLVAKVKNYGLSTIDFTTSNATVYAAVIGSTTQNFNLVLDTGSLTSGATRDVLITSLVNFSTPGIYNVKAWTMLPADTVRLNDTVNVSYDLRKITNYPYEVDFSTPFNPSWFFTQLSGTIAWQRIQSSILFPTIAPQYGSGMLYFPSHTTNTTGSKSRATTPTFDFTGINRPYLEFWMTQDNGASSYPKEGVVVRISSDGGTTWNNDTLFAARYNNTYTTPGWKLFSKILGSYANMTCVKIAFDATSYAGNNIGIDRVIVRDLLDNDLKTNVVYSKGKLPIQGGTPDSLTTIVENIGALTQYNKVVTFDITGANTQTLTYTIDSLPSFNSKTITIGGLTPTIAGANTLTVSVPVDGDNSNNTKTWRLESTTNTFRYADTSAVAIKATMPNGLLLAKYRMHGTHIVNSVKAYITGGTTINKEVYGVIVGNTGTVLGRTPNYTITAADTAHWVTFAFTNWTQTVTADTTFYVGIAQIGTGYNPLGAQTETPVRGKTFYTSSSLTGGSLNEVTNMGRFMIETEIGDLPAYEVALQSITNPVSACGVGIQPVTVNIKNFGYNAISANDAIVSYSVNGGTPISTPVNVAIPSNTQIAFSFTPADFSAPTGNVTYNIKAWVTHPLDVIHYNDTISDYQFISRFVPPTPVISTGNPMSVSYNNPATIIAESPAGVLGNMNWFKTDTSSTPLGFGNTFITANLLADTNIFPSFVSSDGRLLNTIGTGNVSISYVPYYYNYNYSWTASIYKRNEILHNGMIDTLWIEVNSATAGTVASQKVFFSSIADTTFADVNQPNVNSMSLVFDGTIEQPTSGWIAVPLTNPYYYDGSGNLLVYWENREGSYSGNPAITFKSTTMANVSKYKYQDASFPDGLTGTMATSRTNIKFNGDGIGCVGPRANVVIHVTDIPTVELSPSKVLTPVTNCYLHQETISVRVKNSLWTQAPSGASIYYQVNGGTVVTDTIDIPVNGKDSITFTFSQPYDFSAPTGTLPFDLKIWTSINGDTYHVNDTINYNFQSSWTATDITLTDVTIPYGTANTFVYPDWLKVFPTATSTTPIFFGANFTTPILYDTVSYWMQAYGTDGVPMSQLIGSGTATQYYVPFYYNYNYSWAAALYKRSEFANAGTIDTVWFQVSSASTTGLFASQKMFLSVVPDTAFANNSQPDRTTMTRVFNGDITIPASGWIAIPLSTPFNYDGTGSLMMYWENREGSYTGNPNPSFTSSTVTNSAKYAYLDANFPNVAGTLTSTRPNARFTGMNISCPSPKKQITVNVSGIPTQDAGVIRYKAPLGGSYLTTTEHVTVVVKNFGTDPITNFNISYQIGTQTPITETYSGTLNTLDTAVYTFTYNQDLSNFLNPLSVKAYTTLMDDNYFSNDTAYGTIGVPTYCTSAATYPATDMDIGNVIFSGMNNGIALPLYNNTTAINGYTDFSQSIPPIHITKGATYPFSTTQINKLATAYQGKVKVYIDYNRNGVFDANEAAYAGLSSTSNASSTLNYTQLTSAGNILIPTTAQLGYTRMRIVSDEYDVAPSCATYSYGETEDYTVLIDSAIAPDAALTNFVLPSTPTSVEGIQQPIKVNFLNAGNAQIDAATITLIHNSTQIVQNWTGTLTSLTSVVDSITTVSLVAGVNNFTAYVDLIGDNFHYNDTIRFKIDALPKYDLKPVSVLNPIATNCPNSNEKIVVRITNLGVDTLFLANNNVVVKTQVLLNDVADYQTTLNTGYIAKNGTLDVNVTSVANLSTGGAYRIRAIVYLVGDGNMANDTLLSDTILITPTTVLPVTESFQTFTVGVGPFPNGWTSNSTTTTANPYLWRANMGATLSGAVSGPSVDHTNGNISGKYAYVYGGYGATNDVSQLISKCYKFTGITGQLNRVSYWYHMFNPGTAAKLTVEYGSGDNWVILDTIVGPQQTIQTAPWIQRTLTIPNDGKNGRIRFSAKHGSTPGDIAIDDINLVKLLPDVGVTSIITPGSYPNDSVMANHNVFVKVKIHNFGQLPMDTIPVAYKVRDSVEVQETYIGSIAPGADVEYQFVQPYVSATQRTHYLCAYTKLLIDADSLNNKNCKNVVVFQDTGNGFTDYNVAQFTLDQNIPNPASDKALINFNVPQAGKVIFRVTDVLGKELYFEQISAMNGVNSINLNTVNFAPGMYYYWIEYKDKRLVKKMNIIK